MIARRTLLGSLLAVALAPPAFAALSAQDAETVRMAENYFNGIRTLQARFTQVGPDGSLAKGTLYVDRGRNGMRFAYDPPSKILLVAPGDWRLIFYDGSIDQVNTIPVSKTPLGFMMNDQVSLTDGLTVTSVDRGPNGVEIGLIRSDEPDQGAIRLGFSDNPFVLRQWVVTDAQGLTTRVLLDQILTGVKLEPDLFTWRKNPIRRGQSRD